MYYPSPVQSLYPGRLAHCYKQGTKLNIFLEKYFQKKLSLGPKDYFSVTL